MNKPKKLIGNNVTNLLKPGEWETVEDLQELNHLYHLKIKEELQEIINSDHKDLSEFADLIQVVLSFAKENGIDPCALALKMIEKSKDKGNFERTALNNLNPNNPSNKVYFE